MRYSYHIGRRGARGCMQELRILRQAQKDRRFHRTSRLLLYQRHSRPISIGAFIMARKPKSVPEAALEDTTTIESIPLEKLRFDPENPRIVERLGDKPTQAQIEDLLLSGEMKARELVPSFMENGYLPYDPMMVRPHKDHFVVLEGNRRLAALLAMRSSDDQEELAAFQKHNLDSVPCVIFKGDERQLLAYLGLRHLSKTKDWSSSAKAAFVERMLNAGHGLVEASRLINTTTGTLRLMLLTRRLFEQAGSIGLAAR